MAGWISTLLREPDFELDVELGIVPGVALSVLRISALGIRLLNGGAGTAKINLTNTAGGILVPVDYELGQGAIYPEPLNIKTIVGLKGWADIAGVRLQIHGWNIT